MEVVTKDGIDGLVRESTDLESSQAGCLKGVPAMRFGQSHDAEAGSKALFRVRALPQNHVDQGRGVGADPGRLALDLGRRPAGIAPVTGRHVLRHGRVLTVG